MLKKIYNASPIFIKKSANYFYGLIPYERKLSKYFYDTYTFLSKSQWWSKSKLEEYQMEQMKKLVEHAYTNVPYYTSLFNEHAIDVKSIHDFNDFKKIPYLTKDIVHNNLDSLVATNFKKNRIIQVVTGGTTGVPMGFYELRRLAQEREWAFITNIWSSCGYNIHKLNRFVNLRGCSPFSSYYEYRGLDLILSSFHLIEENLSNYLKLIQNFKPDYIQAYPSSISILARYILDNNIKYNIPSLKAIFCSSEKLYSFQRTDIEKAFSTRVFSHYGHSEKSCLACECENSTSYHLKSEYGYTEIINSNNCDVSAENEAGEIVCTGFNNYAMPFIRYKTNDIAINTNETCSCGREYKLLKGIEGRKQDFFVDESGSIISIIRCHAAVKHIREKISAYQYVQNVKGSVMLNLECKVKLNESDFKTITKNFLMYYPRFKIEISVLDKIPRIKNGKFRYLIQNIKK